MLQKSVFTIVFILVGVSIIGAQVPHLINYQGVLIDPATGQPIPDGIYTMVFSIYNSQSPLVTPVWTETHSVGTKDGVYNLMLGSTTPLTSTILSGPEKYLGIKVGSDPEMTPRKRIVSVAYSILSEDADKLDGKHGSEFANADHNHDTRYYTESELNTSDGDPPNQGSNRMSWDNLTDVPTDFADGVDNTGSGDGWSLTGNSGTTPGTNFLGTIDNKALEIKVDNKRALRIEPSFINPNIIGGHAENSVTTGVRGAVIAGGGATGSGSPFVPNRVTDNWSTVGGGSDNQAGNDNDDTGDMSWATVGGGASNTASGYHATIAGGIGNIANASSASVGGGSGNEASGDYATVPGGRLNTAAGRNSFAAGYRAKANHAGTFVWGDNTDADFVSAGSNQFLIRASGGVGIGTNSPGEMLTVRGNILVESASTGTAVAEIGEGLDYAEGFDVSDESGIEPGAVLIIDPLNPGKLIISKRPYDHRVAGIVAGAKGLGSGIKLGSGKFDHDVALAGRVYCNVDASYGEVFPGDLLTTSPTPGYAMVVKEYQKAQGAILGKAMEHLKLGEKKQILVLVTLQ